MMEKGVKVFVSFAKTNWNMASWQRARQPRMSIAPICLCHHRRTRRGGRGGRNGQLPPQNSGNFPENSGNFCMVRKWGINLHRESMEKWTPTFRPKFGQIQKFGQIAFSAPPQRKVSRTPLPMILLFIMPEFVRDSWNLNFGPINLNYGTHCNK